MYGYRNLDVVWKHPTSGGRVFIGNVSASDSIEELRANGITHVVNCTSDMPNKFERGSFKLSYFRFDIYRYMLELDVTNSSRGVLEFFRPVFEFIDAAVANGGGVLVHCLAGAHRAGTTGVAYTMYASNLDHRTAIAACRACRPAVDPIDDLTDLLRQLETAGASLSATVGKHRRD